MPKKKQKRVVSGPFQQQGVRTIDGSPEEPGSETIKAAVDHFANYVRENAGTLSLRAFRRQLEEHLACKAGTLDAPHAKELITELATSLISDEEVRESCTVAAPAATCYVSVLPEELLARAFRYVGQEDLGHIPQVCRTWRAAIQDVGLWRHHLERLLTQPMWAHWHEELQIKRPSLNATAADLFSSYKAACHMLACRVCYDCRIYSKEPDAPRQRQTLASAKLCFALCIDCSRGYAERRAGQRLLTKSTAMHLFKLRSRDLEGIPYGIDTNPINPSFHAMMLYRRPDVVRAAIQRWESVAGMEQHKLKEAHVTG